MEKTSIPEGLTVFADGNAVVVRRDWGRFKGIGLLIVTLGTLWTQWLRYSYAVRGHDTGTYLLMLLEMAPALATGYFALCSLVNRTDVIISASRVRVVSTPLPWWGDRAVAAQEIHGLALKEKKGREDGSNFCLMYIDRAGKERELARAGKGKEQVEFIGKAIGHILGVEMNAAGKRTLFPLHPWLRRFKKNAPAREPETGGSTPSENILSANQP
jgi:hypothetical protein